MAEQNFLNRIVTRINGLPMAVRSHSLTMVLTRAVRFAGTAGIKFEAMSETRVVLSLKNRKKVQNHIGSIHAAAMALLGETATGMVVGMNVPDDKVPVIKTMHVDYVKRCSGDLRAEAVLNDDQIHALRTLEKGEINVPVVITDSKSMTPVESEYVWAWTPKRRG